MKYPILVLSLLLANSVVFSQNNFLEPQLLMADGEVIDITSHTAPYIYDFNKDGVNDLIVGDFGDVPLEGMAADPVYGRYTQGRCHIFINKGTSENPIYEDSFLLMAGGEPAYVPITCCVGFTPRFVDMNNDGYDDVISGSYPGEVYLFKGLINNDFEKGVVIKSSDGDSLFVAHSTAVEPFDYDGDGDYDLIISTRMNGTYLSLNTGSKENPVFSKGEKIDLPKYNYVYKDLNEPRKSHISHAHPADWDGDGLFDLVCGTEEGHLVWYKNTGTKIDPQFLKAETLFVSTSGYNNVEGGIIRPIGGRCKVFVTDYMLDGQKDILVGDFYSAHSTKRELTPKEEMEWDVMKKRRRELLLTLKSMYPDVKQFRQVAFFGKYDDLPKKEKKTVIKINKEYKKIGEKLGKYQKLQKYHGHGYVWLFQKSTK